MPHLTRSNSSTRPRNIDRNAAVSNAERSRSAEPRRRRPCSNDDDELVANEALPNLRPRPSIAPNNLPDPNSTGAPTRRRVRFERVVSYAANQTRRNRRQPSDNERRAEKRTRSPSPVCRSTRARRSDPTGTSSVRRSDPAVPSTSTARRSDPDPAVPSTSTARRSNPAAAPSSAVRQQSVALSDDETRKAAAIAALKRIRCDLFADQAQLLGQNNRPSLYRHAGCVVFTRSPDPPKQGHRYNQILAITDPSLHYRSNSFNDVTSKRSLDIFATFDTLPKVETLDVMVMDRCKLRVHRNAPQVLINFGPGAHYAAQGKAFVFSREQYQAELDKCRRDEAHEIRLQPSWCSSQHRDPEQPIHADLHSAVLHLFRWFDDEKVRLTVQPGNRLHPDDITARHLMEDAEAASSNSEEVYHDARSVFSGSPILDC